MRKITLSVLTLSILFSSCASIVSKSKYPVTITSNPSEATIKIVDRKGKSIYSGATPANLNLKASSGFFSKAIYMVTFEKDGYQTVSLPLTANLDGWFFGNIIIGGVIGLLIIDPATGAMYKIKDDYLNANLQSIDITTSNELKVVDINTIPTELLDKLEEVK